MKKLNAGIHLGWIVLLFFSETSFAETVELVTYYPAAATTGDLHTKSLTVGTDYNDVTPAAGTAIISDRLGIGPGFDTAVPNNLLQIASGAAGEGISLTGVSPGLTLFDGMNLRGGLGVASAAGQYGAETLPGDLSLFSEVGNLRFGTTAAAGNPSVRMTITPGGNVGIGTAAPAGLLHVAGVNDATSNVLFMPGQDTAAAGDPAIRVGIGTAAPAGPLHVVGVNDAASNVLFMPGTDTAAAGTPEIRVGIGNLDPQVSLDVGQNGAIRIGDAYLSSGGPSYVLLASNGWYDGAWRIPNVAQKSATIWMHDGNIDFFSTRTPGAADWTESFGINPGDASNPNGVVRMNAPLIQHYKINTEIKAAIGNDTTAFYIGRDSATGEVHLYYWNGSQHRRVRLGGPADDFPY